MKLSCSIIACIATFGYFKMHGASATTHEQQEPHIVTWSFVTREAEDILITSKNLPDLIGIPGAAEIAALRQREQSHLVSGIVVLYGGRVSYSDLHGQIIVPLVEPTNELIFVVTERIKPKIIHGNTVETWTVDKQYPAEWFSLKRVDHGLVSIWHIERMINMPAEIPYTAIVICTDPETIEVPIGTWPTVGGVNLIVPNIYMTGIIAHNPSALNSIAISRFFRPTHPWFAYAPERYVLAIT